MPRLVTRAGESFTIELEGALLRVETAGKTTTRRFLSPEHARIQLEKLVAEKAKAGYREAPDVLADDDARAVLADELLAHGDPRGELMAIGLALARTPASATRERKRLAREQERVVETHREALFGELAPYTEPLPKKSPGAALAPTFRLGLMEEARIQAAGELHVDDVYVRLRRLPIAQHLVRLAIGSAAPRGAGGHAATYGPLFRAMVSAGVPAHLRELVLGDVRASTRARLGVGNLGTVLPLFGSVETLVVRGRDLDLRVADRVALPKLRSLELRAVNVALLDGLAFVDAPNLASLGLGSFDGAALVERLLALPAFGPSLRALALPDCALDDSDLARLVEEAPRLRALTTLDLRRNRFSRAAVKRATAALPTLRAGGR